MATEKKPVVASFLKDLPSYKKENFSRFVADSGSRNINTTNKPDTRAASGDDSLSQAIVTEKTSILLRYLHNQWDKKHVNRKRNIRRENEEHDHAPGRVEEGSSSSSQPRSGGQPARKMPRTL